MFLLESSIFIHAFTLSENSTSISVVSSNTYTRPKSFLYLTLVSFMYSVSCTNLFLIKNTLEKYLKSFLNNKDKVNYSYNVLSSKPYGHNITYLWEKVKGYYPKSSLTRKKLTFFESTVKDIDSITSNTRYSMFTGTTNEDLIVDAIILFSYLTFLMNKYEHNYYGINHLYLRSSVDMDKFTIDNKIYLYIQKFLHLLFEHNLYFMNDYNGTVFRRSDRYKMFRKDLFFKKQNILNDICPFCVENKSYITRDSYGEENKSKISRILSQKCIEFLK